VRTTTSGKVYDPVKKNLEKLLEAENVHLKEQELKV
jgi:hypothetical protein